MHGHTVGGTNPSLVEALGAGSAILAHDNCFNRWVAGPEAKYFDSENLCAQRLDEILGDATSIKMMREASIKRHSQEFTWPKALSHYESLLLAHCGGS